MNYQHENTVGDKLLKNRKIFLTFTFFSLIGNTALFSQSAKKTDTYFVDYYGIVSDAIDSNMARMTSDLYYTQLCEIQNFNVTDKRISATETTRPSAADFSDDKLSFYTEIVKNEDESWSAIIYVFNKSSNATYSKKTQYDSFYKILVESKQNLQESIRSLIENNTSNSLSLKNLSDDDDFDSLNRPKQLNGSTRNSLRTPEISVSSETLSGNWIGEDYIDKIVIMRGGRGFIIFKNGASMNIAVSISLDNSTVNIKQTGKTNASFFPELPRATALNAALEAEPIEWELHSSDSNTLTGKKRTLLPNNDSYEYGYVDVTWKRNN